MSLSLQLVETFDYEFIIPLLRDADEDEQRMRTLLTDGLHTSYVAYVATQLVGAVTVRWDLAESEIEYIATVPTLRGHGYGKRMISALLTEARQRGVQAMLVGTGNSSWENIAFYQKCGFRMDHVRRDFFSYIQPPLTEDGIVLRDMLVLRLSF